MAERLWQNLISGIDAPALDHRRPMLIYWHMSHVMKYVLNLSRLPLACYSRGMPTQGARHVEDRQHPPHRA